MEESVRLFAAIHFFAIGLSHVFQHRTWAEFFLLLRSKGRAGNFVNAFITLGFGSIVVSFHNVWTGRATILTIVGWAQVLKATLYFLFPAYGMKGLARVSPEKAHHFIYAGVGLLSFAGIVVYGWL